MYAYQWTTRVGIEPTAHDAEVDTLTTATKSHRQWQKYTIVFKKAT